MFFFNLGYFNKFVLLIVSGAEIFSPFVGDSEKAIVELFR